MLSVVLVSGGLTIQPVCDLFGELTLTAKAAVSGNIQIETPEHGSITVSGKTSTGESDGYILYNGGAGEAITISVQPDQGYHLISDSCLLLHHARTCD